MKSAPKIVLTDEQRAVLLRWSRGRSTPVRLMERARIVLLAAEGKMNKDIAAELGILPNTVVRWRGRFARGGLSAIEKDLPRRVAHPFQGWGRDDEIGVGRGHPAFRSPRDRPRSPDARMARLIISPQSA